MSERAPRTRRLIIVDVDSTFITSEQIDLLADRAGTGDRVAAITERAMAGELDFAASLTERVSALAGLPVSALEQVRDQVRLSAGAAELVTAAHERDWPLALVSGGFHEIVDPLAERHGITRVRANRLEVADGALTGRVTGEIVDRAAKARWLRYFADQEGIDLADTVAIGDGANDLDMLAVAGLGVAFNAKPVVAAQADRAITEGGLDRVLEWL
ncbi:phosphoserine phosphatase SerB [Ruania alba]|uniref:phosphoserine phosphatase n=1 Tax=Ruania alba TaxID=648782 RepID=A0A1H5EL15_9MICO|nr:phosphoserine phosphatase SerB [Ruania alba]SED91847.1 phosphoserine phosphatase [Ruania alba]